jgi:hypothetical protein
LTVRTEGGNPCRASSSITAGTVSTRVTGSAVPARARASSTSTTAPPTDSGAKSSNTDMSKLKEVEARTRASSCRE